MNDELMYFNGIDGDAGDYELPPMTGDDLYNFITGTGDPENLSELRSRHGAGSTEHFGVKEGVDPKKLDESGWGVIFAHDEDPAVIEALSELLSWRQQQAGQYFRLYKGGDGFRVGRDNKGSFLARHGAGPGPADPEKVPYYLLIVGSPEKIPYRFQSQIDVQYAVGRIHFQTLQEYANYARSVVEAEGGAVKLSRDVSFFSVSNPDDKATNLCTEYLLEPLFNQYREEKPDWQYSAFTRSEATKSQLSRLLGGDQTPALLFTGSHGMGFPMGSDRQFDHQGALLCQDWPGPQEWKGKGAIPQDFYFAGDDLDSSANLHGLMAFFFACYGGGTPLHDEFAKQSFKERKQIAPEAFLAQLPCKMLSHPGGGALAVIGHVDRAWGYSFTWPKAGAQTAVFESTMTRLLEGHPVGSALEYFNERYAELSTVLADMLEEVEFGMDADPYEISGMWTANNDARGYAVIGDPAVRLPVAEVGEATSERATITISSVDEIRANAGDIMTNGVAPTVATPAVNGAATHFSAGEEVESSTEESAPTVAPTSTSVSLKEIADELKIVKVVTSTTSTTGDESQEVAIRSTITLDGDVETLVMEEVIGENQQLMTLHQAMVKEAVEARLAFLKLQE